MTCCVTRVCACNPCCASVNELWATAGLMTVQDFAVIVVPQIVLQSLSVMHVVPTVLEDNVYYV